MSCAVPGMNFISLGSRRSIFICDCPAVAPCFPFPPRRRFSSAITPVASTPMSNLPSRVSLVISPADMQHSIASHPSRRAASAGCTARMWSSRNSIVAITMSPRAMSSWHSARRSGSFAHWSAACTASVRPGISRRRSASARVAALDR